jgi:hypothetical protein
MGGRAQPVGVDVSNLWQLQAQCGQFLFTDHPWYRIYDMDRIVFPWTGAVTYPGREQIYPQHKSRLEMLLDEFLAQEERRRRAQYFSSSGFHKLFANVHVDTPPTGYHADQFNRPLARLPSWPDLTSTLDHFTTGESFHATVGKVVELRLGANHLAPTAPEQLEAALRAALSNEAGIRQQAIRWTISGLPSQVDAGSFDIALRSLWNGVRRLPVEDSIVAAAAKELLCLWHLPDCASANGHLCDAAFASWKDDAFYVEVSWANLHSRAYCSRSDLLACVDEDWVAARGDVSASASATGALQSTWDPSLIFNFKLFEELFVTQVVPSQLALRRDAVAYDAARISAFSIA